MTTILHATTLHCAPAPPRAGSLAARRSTALGGSPSSSAALARTNPTTHRSSSVRMITMPTTRAGFLDGLLGGGKPGEKRVTRPRPGTRTVLICTTCKNKGSEMCPGCNGTCRVSDSSQLSPTIIFVRLGSLDT
mmetsp:Transcript_5778/g.14663  ORF Transcript_5778/g.14663 Transcript_5778/m.14663 type:complete len:134 (-) Transcript_5778:739-1140(-)